MTILEMENISRTEQTVRVLIAIAISVTTLTITIEPLMSVLLNMFALVILISGLTAIDPVLLVINKLKRKMHFTKTNKETHAT